MIVVDRIISLGAWCQTAHQIERVFGRQWSSPYAWTVTPFRALIASLEDKGERFGKSLVVCNEGQDLMCREYGMLYHHEFHRDAAGMVQITAEEIVNCRSKLLHKMSNLVDAVSRDGHTLYIRFGGFAEKPRAWPYKDDPDLIKHDDINELCRKIEIFSGNSNFTLVFAYHPTVTGFAHDGELDRRAIVSSFEFDGTDRPDQDWWKGNNKNWDRLFAFLATTHRLPAASVLSGA